MRFLKNPTNQQIAGLLTDVAAALEVKEKNSFRIRAYQRAARVVKQASLDIRDLWQENKLEEIPGIGKNIASYLDELFQTGRVKHFNQVLQDLPQAMFQFTRIPGIGPKHAYRLAKELKIKRVKNCLKRLEKAAKAGKIRQMEGFGEKSEEEILQGLKEVNKSSQRLLLPVAMSIGQKILDYLKKLPEVKKADLLGSLRRRKTTIGDIDIAVASNKPVKVINHFLNYPQARRTVESGEKKARLIVSGNHQIDLMVEPFQSYGSLLQHFTGSKEHNIHLRKIAQEKGLSLSEQGIRRKKDKKAKKIKYSSERKFYQALGMVWIPPELREDKGEIEAALKNKLPRLVKFSDLKGDLHIHSSFKIETSHDLGQDSMEKIIKKAEDLNYQYLAFSEHNPSISRHNKKQIITLIKRKKDKIDKLNYSREKNKSKTKKRLFIFNSLEIDIRPNGKRALPDKALQFLDFGIGAVHSSFQMNKKKMTQRILQGLNHPKIKILAHRSGRLLKQRSGYELDWDKIFDFCRKNNKFLEINSYPDRLDLSDILVRKAIKQGLKLVINTDSHQTSHLQFLKYGIAVARRGWAEKKDIVNSLSCDKIKKLITN